MQDQRIQTVADEEAQTDQAVLGLLLTDSAAIWSVEEMASEIDNNAIHVTDSINRLARVGLVHRLDGFVFATPRGSEGDRAGTRLEQPASPLGEHPALQVSPQEPNVAADFDVRKSAVAHSLIDPAPPHRQQRRRRVGIEQRLGQRRSRSG